MTSRYLRHMVARAADAMFAAPDGWAATATGFRRWSAVGETTLSTPDSRSANRTLVAPSPRNSFEESVHQLEGAVAHRVTPYHW